MLTSLYVITDLSPTVSGSDVVLTVVDRFTKCVCWSCPLCVVQSTINDNVCVCPSTTTTPS